MNKAVHSIARVFRGAAVAWKRYPASISCATAFSIVTMIRIQLDWQQQEPYNFLLNCLHWAFALGAVFSLAAVVFAASRSGAKKAFTLANLAGALAAIVTFGLLFLFARTTNADKAYDVISAVAQIRVTVLIFISLILFVLFAGFQEGHFEFDRSLFMTEKAFFISLLYGLVLFSGASGVASAIEYLIYSDLSEKVFMYIGTLSGLIGFMIFVGYFPEFTKGIVDEKREKAQQQPRFIEILFSYIMVPIVLALTLVLLIWTARTVLNGMQVRFLQLYSITATYTIGGLWLHAMTVRNESGLAKTYRIVYPYASIVILIFEGWAVVSQLLNNGLKGTEYIFILLGLLALAGIILLILKKTGAHQYIALAACILALFAVLPGIGYKELPVTAQVNRLEKLLTDQGMLTRDTISPAAAEPEESTKIAITDAVYYLLNEREAKLPAWFDRNSIETQNFEDVFGFVQAWPEEENYSTGYRENRGVYLYLDTSVMPIGDYDWAINLQNHGANQPAAVFTGKNGEYTVSFNTDKETMPPEIRISLNGETAVQEDLDGYFDEILERYGLDTPGEIAAGLNDMSITFETESFDALLVLKYAEFSFSTSEDYRYYWVEPQVLYLKEK